MGAQDGMPRFGIALPQEERADITAELHAMRDEAKRVLGIDPKVVLTTDELVQYLLIKVAHLSCHAGAQHRANEKFYAHVGGALDEHAGRIGQLEGMVHP